MKFNTQTHRSKNKNILKHDLSYFGYLILSEYMSDLDYREKAGPSWEREHVMSKMPKAL